MTKEEEYELRDRIANWLRGMGQRIKKDNFYSEDEKRIRDDALFLAAAWIENSNDEL